MEIIMLEKKPGGGGFYFYDSKFLNIWLCERVLSITERHTENFLATDHPPSKEL